MGVPNKPPDKGAPTCFTGYFDPNKPPETTGVYYFLGVNKP